MQGIVVALSASAVAFAVLYLLLTRRIRKLVDPDAILAQIRREVEELIVELNQTTERNISLMEAKLKTLAGVLQKAEKRVAVLRREASTLEQTERAYATLRQPPAPGRVAPRRDEDSQDIVAVQGGPDEDLRSIVISLHRAGISAESIARRTSVPRAKVELIVSLEEEGVP